jgi:hypothetical protein
MNLRDKIGLWADSKLDEMYFENAPFKALKEKALILLVPMCNEKDCKEHGEPCRLPNFGDDTEDQIEWYCYKHMPKNGYCRGCHEFWAGCEDFDFNPRGLCSNCRYDPDFGGEEWDDEPEGWEQAFFDGNLP